MTRKPIVSLLFSVLILLLAAVGCVTPTERAGVSEDVVRQNILGTAFLGQQKWTEAEEAFREALRLDPGRPLLLNNVAVALVQQGRVDEAEAVLRESLAADAQYAFAHYNLGLIQKNRGNFEEAAGHFEAVAAHDAEDLLTQYNLGIVLSRIDRDEEAERSLRFALSRNPTHVSTLYGLGRFLLQKGDHDEGARLIAKSQEIRARSGLDEAVGSQYGEQGPYAMGVDFPGDALAPPAAIEVAFDAAASVQTSDGSTVWTLTRLEPESRTAIVVADGAKLRVLRPDGPAELGAAGAADAASFLALAAGDVDNDAVVDLAAVLSAGDSVSLGLLRQDAQGGFAWADDDTFSGAAATVQAAPAATDLEFVDLDHDGDLDLFWCWLAADGNSSGCSLAKNDGSGRFEVVDAAEHGVAFDGTAGRAIRVGFSDLDNDRDIDLLLAEPAGIHVFTNQRDGTFSDVAGEMQLDGTTGVLSMQLADMNKDGWMDFVLGTENGAELRMNRRGRFDTALPLGARDEARAVVGDYDNDGFLDVAVSVDGDRPRVLQNVGSGEWAEQPDLLASAEAGDIPLAAVDADGDGDLDLLTGRTDGTASLWSNEGGNAHRWIAIDSRGVGDNKFGIGAKVEILAGALRQKFEVTGPVPILAGLGQREAVESVRYLWPSGVLQDEVNQPTMAAVQIDQLDRKGTSCPLLYAWNDGAWSFVTDFLGGAAVGYLHRPGVYGTPDTDEYVKIPQGLTADEDGLLRVRMNNQLEEALWFDSAELLAVDHPAGTEVYPNERLMPGPPWPEFELFASADVRPVASARGVEDGSDLTQVLAHEDRRYVTNFELLPFKGYAEPHTLELDLGDFPNDRRVVLLLDGWIDYADSSSNLAAHQAGAPLIPPRLTIADGRGGWIGTGHLMGFPAGLPKTMTVELSGLFPTSEHRLRIETTMRIYWDRARVLVGGEETDLRVRRLQPVQAELRHGGFPRPTSPDGRKPHAYDPNDAAPSMTWKSHVGAYTPFGPVTDLLTAIDDRFVTTRAGDEVELGFEAPPPPSRGWTRTYLLFTDGFGKDMDPNSAANNELGPMPFHGMPSYPYPDDVVPPVLQDHAGGAPRLVLPSERGWPGAPPAALVSRAD